MASVKLLAVAGSAVLLSLHGANAADLSPLPPVYQKAPPPAQFSGWYLRGDIGFSNQQVKSLYNVLNDPPGIAVNTVTKAFDAAPFFGLGVGYQFTSWLRADLTGEYRGKANFHGYEIVTVAGGAPYTDEYRASKSELVALANIYADLGTWWCITPFVGAGIGVAYNRIGGFLDVNTPFLGVASGGDATTVNLAWALHAGLAYRVTPGLTVEFAYRYLDLGDAKSGDLVTYTGINNVNNPEHFRDITSHDVKVGVRWMLEPEPMYAPPPLVRKG